MLDFVQSLAVLENSKCHIFIVAICNSKSDVSVSISDITVPEEKKVLLAEAEDKISQIEKQFRRGFLTDKERKDNVVQVWTDTTKKVTEALENNMDEFNSINMMAKSSYTD